jgi:hypothetical protein
LQFLVSSLITLISGVHQIETRVIAGLGLGEEGVEQFNSNLLDKGRETRHEQLLVDDNRQVFDEGVFVHNEDYNAQGSAIVKPISKLSPKIKIKKALTFGLR